METGDDYEAEFKFLEASYREDVDTGALPGHATKYLRSYFIGEDSMFWRNPVGGVKVYTSIQNQKKAQTICKLPAVNPATSAADERSFSSARRLKTWLLSRMGDLAVLNGHKRRIDSVSIATQEFVSCNKNRKRSFGTSGNFKK